jgi:ATPase family AAA domain-containing protein 1
MYYIAKSVVANLPLGTDPEKEQHEQARVKATANLRRLDRLKDDSDSGNDSGRGTDNSRRPRKEDFDLDQYESQIAMEVVAPEDIPVGFDGPFPPDFSCMFTNICRYWWA